MEGWEIKKSNNNMKVLINTDTNTMFGNFMISMDSNQEAEEKLFKELIAAYKNYFKPERKQRILHAEIVSGRKIIISYKKNGKNLAIFQLKMNEDIVKDFALTSGLLNAYENYVRSMREE